MKHFTIILTLCLTLVTTAALAMHHEQGGHNHSQHQAATHQGHGEHSAMLDLGSKAEKGVKATAHLKDVRAAMAKAGMKETHHFMVMFSDDKSDKALETGKVAVKIIAPDGAVTGPVELIGMDGHFGADVFLDQQGDYRFEIGSRLADGTTRQYEFKASLK